MASPGEWDSGLTADLSLGLRAALRDQPVNNGNVQIQKVELTSEDLESIDSQMGLSLATGGRYSKFFLLGLYAAALRGQMSPERESYGRSAHWKGRYRRPGLSLPRSSRGNGLVDCGISTISIQALPRWR